MAAAPGAHAQAAAPPAIALAVQNYLAGNATPVEADVVKGVTTGISRAYNGPPLGSLTTTAEQYAQGLSGVDAAGATVTTPRTSLLTLSDTAPTAGRITTGAQAAAESAELMPSLSTALPRLAMRANVAGAIIGTGLLGWQIGTGARKLFIDVDPPDFDANPGSNFGNYGQPVELVWRPGGTTFRDYVGGNGWTVPTGGRYYVQATRPNQATTDVWQFFPGTTSPCVVAPDAIPTSAPFVRQQSSAAERYAYCNTGVGYSPWAGLALHVKKSDVKKRHPRVKTNSDAPDVVSEAVTTPPSLATAATGLQQALDDPENGPSLGAFIDSRTGSQAGDPTVTTGAVPQCTGDSYGTCVGKLTGSGFSTQHRTYVTGPQVDFSKPAGAVVSTTPPSGANVAFSTDVEIRTNPDVADYPVEIPAPVPNELRTAYRTRVESAGFTNVRTVVLTDATLDTSKGPDAVVDVSPSPGTRAKPGSEVIVRVNPETAPKPVPGGGSGGATGIDLQPLRDAGAAGCSSFPFGVPCYVVASLSVFAASVQTPVLSVPIPSLRQDPVTLDMARWDSVAALLRLLILATTPILMAMKFFAYAFGGTGGGGGGGGED